jgi:uncharacterized membrane protein
MDSRPAEPDPLAPSLRADPKTGIADDVRLVHTSWSGPLPPPAELRQYEQMHPGLAERLVVVFEEQMAQRHRLEFRVLDDEAVKVQCEFAERRRGQYLAFAICLAAIIGGTWAAIAGREAAGSIIGGTGLAGLAAAFIYGRAAGRHGA